MYLFIERTFDNIWMSNFSTLMKIRNVSRTANQHIRMISEGLCDPEDCTLWFFKDSLHAVMVLFRTIAFWRTLLCRNGSLLRCVHTRREWSVTREWFTCQCKDAIDNPAALFARMRRRELEFRILCSRPFVFQICNCQSTSLLIFWSSGIQLTSHRFSTHSHQVNHFFLKISIHYILQMLLSF